MIRPLRHALALLGAALTTLTAPGAQAGNYHCSGDGLDIRYVETGSPPTARSLTVRLAGGIEVVYDDAAITETAVPMGRLLSVSESGSKRNDSLLIPHAGFTDDQAYPFYGWLFVTSTNKAALTPLVESTKGRRLDCQAASVGLYKVGGNVSADTIWSGVTLFNNGGDALSLTGTGGFAFTPSYPVGTLYNVTASPGLNAVCNVSNGSGLLTGNVGNVGVSCQCKSGFATCGGDSCAYNLMNDPANCGQCGVSCGPGKTCFAGGCVGTAQRLLR